MNDSQQHRGPDEEGIHVEPGVGLGHKRLSIIDLTTGQQPLYNEDRSVCIVYNGEIYNYQELIPELVALGHTFRTKSDTEVIVHAWEEWGERCVERFRGMFAFALWDRNRETLFLARDRLGVKPLYYAMLPDGMVLFGSELKSLLAHGGMARDIDPLAIEEYFALGYVAEPRTIFKAASKLPPAHTLLITPRPAGARAARVLGRALHARASAQSDDEACEELVARLRESVKLRMISEVPLGAFLSGGVDSSAVVAMMAGLSAEPVNTCSIAFADPAFNESEFAQSGRGPLPHEPPRRARRDRRLRSHRRRSRRCTTSPTPTARRSRPTASASSRAARDRGAVGRRRRRELRRLPPLSPAPDGRAHARVAAAGHAPSAVRPARARLSEARLGAARAPREDDLRGARAELGRGLLPLGVDPARPDARAAFQQRAQVAPRRLRRAWRCSGTMPRRRRRTIRCR